MKLAGPDSDGTCLGLLTFSCNISLDGCFDHQEGIADDETHAFFIRLMNQRGAMLGGPITGEMMDSCWPAVIERTARDAPPLLRSRSDCEWCVASGDSTLPRVALVL